MAMGIRLGCLWVTALATLRYTTTAAPMATPTPPTPVQLATSSPNAVYYILTYDEVTDSLVFAPPNTRYLLLKQTWRDFSISPYACISLEVRRPGLDGQRDRRMFISRTPDRLLRTYGANENFASYKKENRLMSSMYCRLNNGMSPTSFYWSSGDSTNRTTTLLTAAPSQGGNASMVLGTSTSSGEMSCQKSNINILAYPYVEPIDVTHINSRVKRSAKPYRTQLIFDYGLYSYVAIVLDTGSRPKLSLVPRSTNGCKKETWFYYSEYKEYHIDINGQLAEKHCATFRHAVSGDYVVADVSSAISLNAGSPGQSGLVLKNSSKFGSDITPTFPDYRFFALEKSVLQVGDNNELTLQTFCPLFHKRYCLRPNIFDGSLELKPVGNDSSLTPTFESPSNSDLANFFLETPRPRGASLPILTGLHTNTEYYTTSATTDVQTTFGGESTDGAITSYITATATYG